MINPAIFMPDFYINMVFLFCWYGLAGYHLLEYSIVYSTSLILWDMYQKEIFFLHCQYLLHNIILSCGYKTHEEWRSAWSSRENIYFANTSYPTPNTGRGRENTTICQLFRSNQLLVNKKINTISYFPEIILFQLKEEKRETFRWYQVIQENKTPIG